MGYNLLDLPAELQLNIIDELVRDENIKADAHDDCRKEKQDDPIRIYPDLIHWSSTCSFFRNLLAPAIFRSVKVVNKDKSGCSLNAVAESPYSNLVKELHFVGSALGPAHKDEVAFTDIEGILPGSVEALLSDLQRFSSLERLSMTFDYDLVSSDWSREEPVVAAESVETVKTEESVAWRALMSRTYSAVAKNKSPNFKHLEIRQLVWKKVSTLSQVAFHEFLCHFEQFSLSIYGDDIGRGYVSNGIRDYFLVMGELDSYFFNHLANVTTLSIKAPKTGPLGLQGWTYVPFTLRANQMPLLTTLHLDYIFVSQELIDFLVGHKYTLENVSLRNCYASTIARAASGASIQNQTYWSELFISLFSADPPRLRHFELLGSEMRSPSIEQLNEEGYEKVRTILWQDPGRMMFPYAFLAPHNGNIYHSQADNLRKFLRGDDQRSWDRLMRLVEGNATKAATSKCQGMALKARS